MDDTCRECGDGAINGWAWLLPMTPTQRERFLRGVADGVNPAFWLRQLRQLLR